MAVILVMTGDNAQRGTTHLLTQVTVGHDKATTSGGCAASRPGRASAISRHKYSSTSPLQSVALGLLEEHLSRCVTEAVAEGSDGAAEKVHEASGAIARLVRS